MKLFRSSIVALALVLVGAGCQSSTAPSAAPDATVPAAVPTAPPDTAGRTLDLHGKGLTKVPDDVFRRTDITSLDLSGNLLTGALPAEIRQLRALRILDASDNDMTGVPAEIGQLTELRTLDLSGNRLTGLPYELGNLKNLETLDLRGNQVSEDDLAVIRKGIPQADILR